MLVLSSMCSKHEHGNFPLYLKVCDSPGYDGFHFLVAGVFGHE